MKTFRALSLCAAVAGCSSSDSPGSTDTATVTDTGTATDTVTEGSADTVCVRPTISTTNLGERCDGTAAVTCPTGQSCRYKSSPTAPPPPKYCLISCTDDCACPAGYDCLPSTSGGPVPYCVEQE